MKECVIFTGGDLNISHNFDTSYFNNKTIVAADAGYLYAKRMGLKTNIIIGDFDTLLQIPKDVDEIIKYPKEKDDTDTMLAIKLALKRGYKDIEIYGALGKRFDHTYANIQALAYILSKNAKGRIISDTEYIYMIENEGIKIPQKEGFSLSVFSYSDICKGVNLSGVKYPLNNATLKNTFPLGVCNEILEKNADISVKHGKMLIILSKK